MAQGGERGAERGDRGRRRTWALHTRGSTRAAQLAATALAAHLRRASSRTPPRANACRPLLRRHHRRHHLRLELALDEGRWTPRRRTPDQGVSRRTPGMAGQSMQTGEAATVRGAGFATRNCSAFLLEATPLLGTNWRATSRRTSSPAVRGVEEEPPGDVRTRSSTRASWRRTRRRVHRRRVERLRLGRRRGVRRARRRLAGRLRVDAVRGRCGGDARPAGRTSRCRSPTPHASPTTRRTRRCSRAARTTARCCGIAADGDDALWGKSVMWGTRTTSPCCSSRGQGAARQRRQPPRLCVSVGGDGKVLCWELGDGAAPQGFRVGGRAAGGRRRRRERRLIAGGCALGTAAISTFVVGLSTAGAQVRPAAELRSAEAVRRHWTCRRTARRCSRVRRHPVPSAQAEDRSPAVLKREREVGPPRL